MLTLMTELKWYQSVVIGGVIFSLTGYFVFIVPIELNIEPELNDYVKRFVYWLTSE